MSEPFLGMIAIFGFNFAPRGWAFCSGQLLSIAQNTALFSLLGTTYGGNGQTNFALPDLRGRVPLSQGQGPGLSSYVIGEVAGQENVTLNISQIPSHNHLVNCVNAKANKPNPVGNLLAQDAAGATAEYSNAAAGGTLAANAITSTGGSQPHSILQPFLTLNFCIALEGIFPSRN